MPRITVIGITDAGPQSLSPHLLARLEGAKVLIRQYIVNNPAGWEADQDNTANLWM